MKDWKEIKYLVLEIREKINKRKFKKKIIKVEFNKVDYRKLIYFDVYVCVCVWVFV